MPLMVERQNTNRLASTQHMVFILNLKAAIETAYVISNFTMCCHLRKVCRQLIIYCFKIKAYSRVSHNYYKHVSAYELPLFL